MRFVRHPTDWRAENYVTSANSEAFAVSVLPVHLCYLKCLYYAVHINKKYSVGKLEEEDESARWRTILKKLNTHIRYRRASQKKK